VSTADLGTGRTGVLAGRRGHRGVGSAVARHHRAADGAVVAVREIRSAGDAAPDDETVEAAIRFGQAQLATGDFPHTPALVGGEDPRTVLPRLIGATSERQRFRGLDVLLHGAARTMNLSMP
jgi:hypothetical protein